jgi:hypothetical protein
LGKAVEIILVLLGVALGGFVVLVLETFVWFPPGALAFILVLVGMFVGGAGMMMLCRRWRRDKT